MALYGAKKIPAAVAAFAALCCIAGPGCERNRQVTDLRAEYDAVEEILENLYIRIHPLRSSRLGLHAADSTLFTLDAVEIEAAVTDLEALLARVSGAALGGRDGAYINDLAAIVSWIRGEIYAFRDLRVHENDPLVYCWILEEALFGTPYRIEPPHDGERGAYERRLARLPALLTSARRNLKRPPVQRIELAAGRLRDMQRALPALERTVRGRYGAPFDYGPARGVLDDLLAFVEGELAARPHTSFMLGTENLSRTFFYDEQLTLDPNIMMEEAGKQIQRLQSQLSAIRGQSMSGSEAAPIPDSLRDAAASEVLSRIAMLDEKLCGKEGTADEILEVRFVERPRYLGPLPKNPYLTVPYGGESVSFLEAPSAVRRDGIRLVIRTKPGGYGDGTLERAAVNGSCLMRGGLLASAEIGRKTRILLQSDLYLEGLLSLADMTVPRLRSDGRLTLDLVTVERRLHALAMMTVVFRLHAGTFTTEAALAYLQETLGMPREEAAGEVLAASAHPQLAYPGIADRYITEMTKKISLLRGSADPQRELAELLRQNGGLSLPLIDKDLVVD